MFAGPESVLPGDVPQAEPAGPRRTGFLAGAALLACACAGLLGVALWAGGEARPPAHAAANFADLGRALAPYGEVEAVAAPGGRVLVKGFVESRARRQALEKALAPLGPIEVRVVAVDELVEQARRYVGSPAVAISYAGKGQIVLSGASDDEAVRDKVRRLAEDLHPSVLVSDKVSWKPGPAVDRDAEARAHWAAWQELLPSRMVGITEDESGLRSIQLANGDRYYEGAPLKSGGEITHIDAGGLEFAGGGRAASK
jgi:type III secretion protein D